MWCPVLSSRLSMGHQLRAVSTFSADFVTGLVARCMSQLNSWKMGNAPESGVSWWWRVSPLI